MKDRLIALLRWSEKYTKTDMVYLAQAGLWINLGTIVQSVLSLGLSIAFANLVSADVYGTYQYLLAISALVAAASLSGMNTAVIQAVSRGYEGVLRTSVRAQLVWATVPAALTTLAAVYYFLWGGNATIALGLLAVALAAPLTQAFNTYNAFLSGKREFRAGFISVLAINLAYYVAMFVAIAWLKSPAAFAAVSVGVTALANFLAYRWTLARYQPNDRVDPVTIPYGRRLSVLGGFGTVMHQLDSILVFHFLGAVDLAVYSFATLVPERAASFFGFIGTAGLPKFANRSLEDIRRHLPGRLARIVVAGAAIALVYALAAPYIFHLLFPHYLSAISLTEAYAAIIMIISVENISSSALYAKRLTRSIYAIGIAQPILLVGLQIPLLLAYGLWGMIIARIISEAIGVGLGLLFTYYPIDDLPVGT